VRASLQAVDMLPLAKRPIGQLSGGQQQRLSVGLAFVNDPDIVFLDEPKEGYYGGQVATPVFKQIAERAANYLNIHPDKTFPALAELPAELSRFRKAG
jgi:ABC-type lipoprotein export system ATPase subunit